MNWIKKQSSFKYSGKPVTRTTMTCQTPLGEFKVFEAVGGDTFIIHPFLKSRYINNILDWGSFDNGLEEWFGKTKMRCKSLEDGLKLCEQKWNQVKEAVNQI